MKKKPLVMLILLTQCIGAIFYALFIASYALALPSNRVLHGEPIFRIPLSIFGGLFLALVTLLLILSFMLKPKETRSPLPKE